MAPPTQGVRPSQNAAVLRKGPARAALVGVHLASTSTALNPLAAWMAA